MQTMQQTRGAGAHHRPRHQPVPCVQLRRSHTGRPTHITTAARAPDQQQAQTAALLSPTIERVCGDLPIRAVIMDVLHTLDTTPAAVLQAPPGAGKTSTVPLALLAHRGSYLTPEPGSEKPKCILVLEPRRVAAKAAARRMAALLDEKVGDTVGYRVRLESRISRATCIEVITEGVLLRRLQQDPELAGVGAVLFDEFHERNLDADLALTLALDLAAVARPDLRLLVMSATLGGGLAERCAALLASVVPGGAPAPVLSSEGRSFPVRTVYLGPPSRERLGLEAAVAEATVQALRAQERGKAPRGDVLAFLPGVAEIRHTERLLLKELPSALRDVEVMQLHGGLAPAQQDRVVGWKAVAGGLRRVILSTPIAESSLTLSGVTAVVDSGLRRSPVFDAATGVNRLQTVYISEASAEQRAGRAGRVGPGVAYRLWSPEDPLQGTTPPEILEADLAPLALQLACWGVDVVRPGAAAASLAWLDAPPPARLADAVQLLQELGALDAKGRMTDQGRAMSGMGVHPRLAAMVLRGAALGVPELAALLAALLSERDLLRGGGKGAPRTASLVLRVCALAALAGEEPGHIAGGQALLAAVGPIERVLDATDLAGARRVLLGARSVAASLRARVLENESSSGHDGSSTDDESADDDTGVESEREEEAGGLGEHRNARPRQRGAAAGGDDRDWHKTWVRQAGREGLVGALVALAYPDRLALRMERSNARPSFALAGGGTVRLRYDDDPLGQAAELLAVAELSGAREGSAANDAVALAASLSRSAVDAYLRQCIVERDVVFWASSSKAVLARRQRCLGRLVLQERSQPVSDDQALPALLQGFREMGGVSNLGLPRDLEAWRQRVAWLRRTELAAPGVASTLPDLTDEGLFASAPQWLPPYLSGVRSKADMARLDWAAILRGMVSREDAARVERDVPTTLLLPTGSRAHIDYSRDTPTASCRIQEVFGLAETPRLAGGRVPLLLELLSPSKQPLQVTADLGSFWRGAYSSVLKEQRGRYPKHYWPEDPLQAQPTRLTKKGMAAAEARQQEQQQRQREDRAGGTQTPASGRKKRGRR